MFKFRVSQVLIGFLLFIMAVLSVKSDEIRFLHHFEDMNPDLALGDAKPTQETAKIVKNGWDFHGNSQGSGLEVVNGTRLDFNSKDNVDWNLGSLEFWVMPYVDMKDATNHKFFCTPIGHDDPKAVHIWKTAMFDDLRFRLWDDIKRRAEAVWKGSSEWKAKEWHHIAVSWENKKEVNMYVDGKLVASGQASWEFKKQYETFSVGGQGGALTTNGVIDELVIYDYVISEDYVKERFNAVRPLRAKTAIEARDKLATMWGRLKVR